MWIIGIILGAALLFTGISVKKIDRKLRMILTVVGGILLGVSLIYGLLVILLIHGIP